MNIASPLSRYNEALKLIKAGAREFYCGVSPKLWNRRFGYVSSITRRNNDFAHLSSFEELEKVIKQCNRHQVKVHVTLNECYSRDQMEFFLDQFKMVESLGAHGIILGDPAPLCLLPETGTSLKIIMGTGGTALNAWTVRMYKEMGVKRVILPRHLSINEIRSIVGRDPDMEYESFIFRGLCPFIDGFCRFQHGINEMIGKKPRVDLACSLRYRIRTYGKSGCRGTPNEKIKHLMSPRQSLTGCGLCGLYELTGIPGLNTLKIVGREFSGNEKLENVRIVIKMMNIIKDRPSLTFSDFQRICREEFKKFFHRECTYRDCYFPGCCDTIGQNSDFGIKNETD